MRGINKHLILTDRIKDFKPNEKISNLAEHLLHLNYAEWTLLKEVLDDVFNSKFANVVLEDSDELKQRLEFEFCGISKAQKQTLISLLNKPNNNN